jgi:glutamate-1-semialdehyde 2,1-aminomutase
MRATLEEVLTPPAFDRMISLATHFREGVEATLLHYDIPWSITQLGARAEYRFTRPAPRNGTESAAAGAPETEEYLHLFMANRGLLMTPFHNMALMCPQTTLVDVDMHTSLFREAVAKLVNADAVHGR